MNAVATDMPSSRWRRVAIRRPSCTASLIVPRCSPSCAASRVEVVDRDGQPEEARVALAGAVGLADQLEDHLAEPEEHLPHRRAVGVAVPLAAGLEPDPTEGRGGAGQVGGEQHDVVDVGATRWGGRPGSTGGASDAVVGRPSSSAVGQRGRRARRAATSRGSACRRRGPRAARGPCRCGSSRRRRR